MQSIDTNPNDNPRSDRISIREANEADADVIADLLTQLLNPCVSDDIVVRLQARTQTDMDYVYVAQVDGEVYGLLVLHLMWVLHRSYPIGRISALVVDQTVRGQGIGRRLVEYAVQVCRDQGCGAVEVTSNARRTEAHAFYRSLGFAQPSEYFRQTLE